MSDTAIVLIGPKFAENVGAAARIAANMGIGRLIIIAEQLPDQEKMRAMATNKGARLIDGLELNPDLALALAPFAWVLGTSARQGRKRGLGNSPRPIMGEIAPLLGKNRVALLFGPEDRGLSNEELKFCNRITTIPTADFSSLNLAQAVAILCHELHYSLLEAISAKTMPKALPKQGDKGELEAMFTHVEETLRDIGFLKTDDDYWMKSIREFIGRLGLKSKEIRIIRGICRQLLWRKEKNSGFPLDKKRQKE